MSTARLMIPLSAVDCTQENKSKRITLNLKHISHSFSNPFHKNLNTALSTLLTILYIRLTKTGINRDVKNILKVNILLQNIENEEEVTKRMI